MAKKIQCEQCDAFIRERGLCRKKWNHPTFDNTDCQLIEKVVDEMAGEQKNADGWLNSPESIPYIAREMIRMHSGRLYFEVPETNGFPANRFAGRMSGFMYALACDRMNSKEKCSISLDTIRPYASKEELGSLVKLQQKVEEQKKLEIPPFDDGYVGLLEGMAIFINQEDLSLLYSETDINLNKNCDDDGIPSYAYHRSLLKAGLLLAKAKKKKKEVQNTLMEDGLAEKGARLIVDEMIKYIRKERIKGSVKLFFKGLLFLIIGFAVTGITIAWAESRGGGLYVVTYGAVFVGIIYTVFAIGSFIRAICYR